MREATKLIIKKYALMKLKYDFMGYPFKNISELSSHHLIIPKRDCARLGLGRGYFEWNLAPLVRSSAHDYLHFIEKKDRERFEDITSEIIDQKIKGYLDPQNLKIIDDILTGFEKEYYDSYIIGEEIPLRDSFYRRVTKENNIILKMK